MATYKTSDLYNIISELMNDGYEYVDVLSLDAAEDSPEALSFDAIEDSCSSTEYEIIESCEVPDDYDFSEHSTRPIAPTDYCCELNFTYEEIALIKHATDNALEYFKELLKDPKQSKEIVKDIKQSSVKCRNLQAKLSKFLKYLH